MKATYNETIEAIKSILIEKRNKSLNNSEKEIRATEKAKEFKELITFLSENYGVRISKEFLSQEFRAENKQGDKKAECLFLTNLNNTIARAEIIPETQNRYFKELNSDNKGNLFFIQKRESFNFL